MLRTFLKHDSVEISALQLMVERVKTLEAVEVEWIYFSCENGIHSINQRKKWYRLNSGPLKVICWSLISRTCLRIRLYLEIGSLKNTLKWGHWYPYGKRTIGPKCTKTMWRHRKSAASAPRGESLEESNPINSFLNFLCIRVYCLHVC